MKIIRDDFADRAVLLDTVWSARLAAPPSDYSYACGMAAVRSQQCRWVIGADHGLDTWLCGAPSESLTISYCPYHAGLVFQRDE
jgi:hypothetical protein